MAYLPPYYEDIHEVRAIMQAEGVEIDDLRQAMDEVLNQTYVDSASWGLSLWEKELGLPPAEHETIAERRDRIKSKIRGYGTATIKTIKNVAESYDKGAIDIAEDFSGYTITVYFVDTLGVPSNIEDLKKALRAVVPAHLDIKFEFNYFIWDELDKKLWTWDQLDALTLTWDKLEVYS